MNEICFHGSGGLLYYYMGIANFIQENYNLENISYCGVSGGSIPSFLLSSGLSIKDIWNDTFIPWMNNINNKKINEMFSNNSIEFLIKKLEKHIDNEIINNSINNKLCIKLSKISFFEIEEEYINNWENLNDIIECIIASCWLPIIFGSVTRNYRGNEYIDGGFPRSIDNRENSLHIRINSFQKISEEIKVLLFASSLNMINSIDMAEKLYKQGYEDASNNKEYFSGLNIK